MSNQFTVNRPSNGPKGAGYLLPIRCRAVRVWEENAPKGAEKLEWILLTDLEVESFDQAMEIALIYSTRWLIEELHKAIKSRLKMHHDLCRKLMAHASSVPVSRIRE